MKNRLTALALTGLLAATLTGCSTTAPSTLEPTAATESTATITTASFSDTLAAAKAALEAKAKAALKKLTDKLNTPGAATAAPGKAAPESLAALATLPIKGRAPKTGYSRDQFGPAWSDVDHNGCDTRNDILRRDLTGTTAKPGTKNCVIEAGTLNDPYTGKTIAFKRGAKSSEIQIDHVVALSDAWQTGAQQIPSDKRLALANDPDNLLAVDGPTNQAKSDSDAASWLPPNKAYRCTYVSKQVAVKAKYGLWVTQPEHDAIARVLNSCATA